MKNLVNLCAIALLTIAGNSHAENPVDTAIAKLQKDVSKMQADIANYADKSILHTDKAQIKSDQTTLKAARRAAKNRKDQALG